MYFQVYFNLNPNLVQFWIVLDAITEGRRELKFEKNPVNVHSYTSFLTSKNTVFWAK